MVLYATAEGQPITTQSMIRAFRSCPREALYKYVERLVPKTVRKPLTRGKWMHALLEVYYRALAETGDVEHADAAWKEEHRRWTSSYSKLFDEEKEMLGDLPREMSQLMSSYLWHYGDPAYSDWWWNVHETELTVEAELPNGHLFRCRLDLLEEDEFGLWVWDHKTHRREPDWEKRMLDEQGPLYIWACRQAGIPVRGFGWNYLVTESISWPKVIKDGSRFYANAGESDYPTYVAAVKQAIEQYGGKFLANPDHKKVVAHNLKRYKAARWKPGGMQTSPHFRRVMVEKDEGMIGRVLSAAVRTSDTMHSYDFSDPDCVERNVGACRSFICDYASLSLMDLLKGDSEMIKRREYKRIDDPLAYYGEEEERF
jgi:hypothetical protein